MLVRTPDAIREEGKWPWQEDTRAFHEQDYRELLAVMREAQAPARARLAVMWAYTNTGLSNDDAVRKQTVLTYQEMAKLDEFLRDGASSCWKRRFRHGFYLMKTAEVVPVQPECGRSPPPPPHPPPSPPAPRR